MIRYTPPETHADVGFHLGQTDLAEPHAEVKAFHSQDDGSHEFTILRLGFGTTSVCFFLPDAAAAVALLNALAAACAPHQDPPGLEPTADPDPDLANLPEAGGIDCDNCEAYIETGNVYLCEGCGATVCESCFNERHGQCVAQPTDPWPDGPERLEADPPPSQEPVPCARCRSAVPRDLAHQHQVPGEAAKDPLCPGCEAQLLDRLGLRRGPNDCAMIASCNVPVVPFPEAKTRDYVLVSGSIERGANVCPDCGACPMVLNLDGCCTTCDSTLSGYLA